MRGRRASQICLACMAGASITVLVSTAGYISTGREGYLVAASFGAASLLVCVGVILGLADDE